MQGFRMRRGEAEMLAVKTDWNLTVVQELLDYGVDPNLKASDGQTPLSLAVAKGKTKLAALLESRG
jgi:ankyrin repeat protein